MPSRRAVARSAVISLLVLGAAAMVALVELRQDPRWSLRLLALGLAWRSPTLVHATLAPRPLFASLAADVAEAETKRGGSGGAQGLQAQLRGAMLKALLPEIPLVGEQMLESYLQDDPSGRAVPESGVGAAAAALELDPARLVAWLAALQKNADHLGNFGAPDVNADRAAVPMTLPSPAPGATSVQLVLLLERHALLWQAVGVTGAGDLLASLRATP